MCWETQWYLDNDEDKLLYESNKFVMFGWDGACNHFSYCFVFIIFIVL